MADSTFQLPFLKLEVPKPKSWDYAALAAVVAALALAGGNLFAAGAKAPGTGLSGGLTLGLALAHLMVATASLLILGKTAAYGSIWGNLAAVLGLLLGLSGVLLAAALWTAA